MTAINDEVMLSIIVPVYNHGKYIAEALDSIIMQKTGYSYEVLVGDDCSTDSSRDILREYEKKYPGIFTMYYRTENLFRKEGSVGNVQDLRLRSKGRYLITLEGDDYWTDPDKIEKQIDFLEKHPEYLACTHSCNVVDENSNIKDEEYPGCSDSEYTLKHYASGILPGQLATIMMRNIFIDNRADVSLLSKRLSPGDRLLAFILVTNGRVHCSPEKMSAYRHITNGGSSFSANFEFEYEPFKKWHTELVNYAKNRSKQALKYANLLYCRNILRGIRYKKIGVKAGLADFFKNVSYKWAVSALLIKEFFNTAVLKKKLGKDIIV
ncbi:glycosyltransferase family 2 protein [Ruminococcus sp.]|uniref:glycosyltransferase family 2 protein n=1 Tax=Ruminococcus sp. TaxID=41978 RepID=UPI002E79951C|nr:glycosyltransferase [Ruminococcus sp.]MEE1262286.1 glycosyltransferase [Ruminococcus sp.]